MSPRKLHIGHGFHLPLDAATQTFLILGKRGSGKSSTATRFAEQLIDAHISIAVLDMVDVWWGLKAGADGRREGGKEVYIFGGRHADLPLEPTAGELMADVLVDHRINAVMVLREFSNREKAQFASGFADRLYRRNTEVLHLFAEEAHELIPQQPYGGEEEMVGRMNRLQKLGRTSGIGFTAITQRAASLNKNITTQSEILVAHRLIGPQDVRAVEEWIKHHHQEALKQQVLSTLPELKTGEAWVWAPDFPEEEPIGLKRLRVLMPETFDSRRTPKPGEKRAEPKQLAAVDLEKLGEKMKATRERAKATDPRALHGELARLRAELARKPQMVVPQVKVERVEVPVLKDGQLARVEKLLATFSAETAKLSDAFQNGIVRVLAAWEAAHGEIHALLRAVAQVGKTAAAPGSSPAPLSRPAIHSGNMSRSVPSEAAGRSVKGERVILAAVAQHPDGVTRGQLTVLTGYKRSSRDTYLQRLQARGTVIINGGRVRVTQEGFNELGFDHEPLPTGRALAEHWLQRLPVGERNILLVAQQAYPGAVGRDVVSETTGYKRSSRDTYIQRLTSRELLTTDRGTIRASDLLFD